MVSTHSIRSNAPPSGASAAQAADTLSKLEGQARHHVTQSGGGRMVWRSFGEGAPLVLLHGGHGSWMHWVRNIEALADRHAVWVPDLPGYGDSDAAASTELSSVVAPAIAGLDALFGAGGSIDLVGFSFGGMVAAQIAAMRGHVRRLALLGPAGHGGPRRPRGKLLQWREAAASGDDAALDAIMRHNLEMHMLHEPDRIDALALRVHIHSCMRTRFRSKGLSRAGGLGAILRDVSAETLVIWGEHDVTADPEAIAEALKRTRPDVRTHILPGAGHWVQYDAADDINRLLREWMA
jgi:pimeloyl-ACP methyl ester carboxylesterase